MTPRPLTQEQLNEPMFGIKVGGQALDISYTKYVTEVQVEEEEGKATLARISVTDSYSKWANDKRMIKGSTVEITMGHLSKNRVMLRGKIKNIDAGFPQDGAPTLILTCIDNTTALTKEAKSRSWKKKKLSDVIKSMSEAAGLSIEVEDTKKLLEYIAQSDETDNDFITRKAKELKWYYQQKPLGAGLYFGSKDKYGDAKETLDYKKGAGQIISFSPSFQESTEEADTTGSVSSQTGEATASTKTAAAKASSSTKAENYSVNVDKSTGKVSGN